MLSTDLAQGFVWDFLELNKGTERTWLQLIRSCALHLLQCPNFKKAKGFGGKIGADRKPEGNRRQGTSWRLTWFNIQTAEYKQSN